MTRSNARELAVHFVFELGFSDQAADELLEQALTRPVFETIGKEEPLYAEFPNVGQREYITALVRGWSSTARSWTDTSANTPSDGIFLVFPGWW